MLANRRDYQKCSDCYQDDKMYSCEEITNSSHDSLIAINLISVLICLTYD